MEKYTSLPADFKLDTSRRNRGIGTSSGWRYNGIVEEEQWRPIERYFLHHTNHSYTTLLIADGYFISNKGRVYSTRAHDFIKPCIDKSTGRHYAKLLCSDGKRRNIKLYKLVMDNFMEVPSPVRHFFPAIDHIDNNRVNDSLDNLQYTTPVLNIKRHWHEVFPKIKKANKPKQ